MPYSGGYDTGGGLRVVRGKYDFAVDGGAVSSIDLVKEAVLPPGALILGGFVEVTAACLSATGTIAINTEGAGDIMAAAAQAALTVGRKSIVPAFTGATAVKTTAARKIVATIATAPFTAGAFDVVLFYIKLYD